MTALFMRAFVWYADATSTEFIGNATHPVIIFMPEISKTHMGGTMRLGLRPTVFENDAESWSRTRRLYGGAPIIWERHRHRYEVNPEYVDKLDASGLVFVGKDEKRERMQILELRGQCSPCCRCVFPRWTYRCLRADHPFFVGLQAHPEFCTRPLNPSPPFLGLVAAACGDSVLEEQIEAQMSSFRPPHPEHAMASESVLRNGCVVSDRLMNGYAD
jgi:CTP synthase